MVFRKFDRLLFAKGESTAGTAATITTSADFYEVIEPTFTVTPLMFERFTKSQTLTPQVQTAPGTGIAAPIATCEISFGVEMAGPGTAVSSGTAPKVGNLLKACGLKETAAVDVYAMTSTTYVGGPFFHQENIEGSAGSYSSSDAESYGCNAYGDTEFWHTNGGTISPLTIVSEHSGAAATASSGTSTQTGVGYMPDTSTTDDLAGTTLTMRLYLGGGAYVEMIGAKGTCDFTFTHGDRCVMNFTFTGVLASYTEGSEPADHSYTAEVPAAFINTGLSIGPDVSASAYYTGALFNSMTMSLGNEVTIREDSNAANGYAYAVITARAPSFTFNPDAILSSGAYSFWGSFLGKVPMRARWSVGSTAGNRCDFRVTSGQFSGISDGDRDTVSILDSTTNLTGGNFGSSIITVGGTPSGSTFGSDNEFTILFR